VKSANLRRHKTSETITHSTKFLPIVSTIPVQSTETPVLLPTIKPTPRNDANALLGQSTVLLVICSSRPEYLQRSLSYVVKYHPGGSLPIVISQDGHDQQVLKVINEAKENLLARGLSSVSFTHIIHEGSAEFNPDGYFRLCAHYKFALSSVFSSGSGSGTAVKRVIILEEDLQIAPDFFEFFASTVNILDEDSSLLGVSAWNDNGMSKLVRDEKQLYRSDFFPGLGWMMNRRIWEELSPKWPKAVRDCTVCRYSVCKYLCMYVCM
jgi:alpha-1,3-mannosyl-glycoprotein beta-1,2-N-acetylglucosaminyltransferase